MPQYSLILFIELCTNNYRMVQQKHPIHIATRASIGQLINIQSRNDVQGTSPWQQQGKILSIHYAESSDPQHLIIHLNAIRCLML